MKYSYNWLQSLVSKKLPEPAKLADLLTQHSFETGLVGKVGQDHVLDIDVTPNRAHDCLSYHGIAREVSAILYSDYNQVDYAKKITYNSSRKTSDLVSVVVRDKKLCPRYSAQAVVDVQVGPSPKWLQERLVANGLRPISNIVDIANYVMLETGQPLHTFDADKLGTGKKKKIIVRRAKQGEKMISLDGETYQLDSNILVIADEAKPVCIAGIKGGVGPGIDKNTHNVIIEAANFNQLAIRKASRQLKLETDASYRFERELDPNFTIPALDMCAWLMADIAKGRVLSGKVDVNSGKISPKTVSLNLEKVNSLLGINVNPSMAVQVLQRLGFGVKRQGDKLSVQAPTRRMDVEAPEDLIEEIGRMHGYEKIPSRMPKAEITPGLMNQEMVYQNRARQILSNLGFSEVFNYSMIGGADIIRAGYKEKLVELENPLSQDLKYMRPSLIFNLVSSVLNNAKYFNNIQLFELGHVYNLKSGKAIEENRLAVVMTGQDGQSKPYDFYSLKGVLALLFDKLMIKGVVFDDIITAKAAAVFDNQRAAEIKSGKTKLGVIGELDKKYLAKIGFSHPIIAWEIDFDKVIELASEERIYVKPSKYPVITRDLALLVESGTKVIEVMNVIHAAGGRDIIDIDLFDMFEGESMGSDRKSLAFRIMFQTKDRNLSDKEVNASMARVITALENEGGWEVRR